MDPDLYFPLVLTVFGVISMPLILYFAHSVEERGKDRVRKMYSELVKEKLDVIKTALAMGHSPDEIRELDERLEKLIGTEKMLKTLKKGTSDPRQEARLQSIDLISEVDNHSSSTAKERK